ncbi:hypothetical protein HDU78_004933 [Chytriomyces hyalinus]|nr:hypothetical protein HDU78_004933 [Chytriomyces hyalinus]
MEFIPTEAQLLERNVIADPSGCTYNWTQMDDGVLFSARVAPAVDTADVVVDVDAAAGSLSVSVRGERVLYGKLSGAVDASESKVLVRSLAMRDLGDEATPSTDSRVNPYFKILIVRIKKTSRAQWTLPIQGGIENPTDCDSHSLYLIANALNQTNDPAALKHMNTAADKGSIAAMLKLAAWYEIGREEMKDIPVSKSEDLALQWHKRAGSAGNSEACYIIMTAHASGSHKAEKSFFLALQWSSAALLCGYGTDEDGGAMALEQPRLYQTLLFQTGLLLMEGGFGIGDPKPDGAVAVWNSAAEQGHAQSCWNLGIFYLNGFGLPEPNVSMGISLIRSGMRKVKELSLPPQLTGMSESAIDALVHMDEEMRAQGNVLDIEKLKVMVAMKGAGQLSPASTKPPSQTGSGKAETVKRNNRRREKERLKKLQEKTSTYSGEESMDAMSWNLAVRKSIGVAVIGVGLFGLWKAFKTMGSN